MSTKSDIAHLLENLPKARILCVGDVMLDRFVEGAVDRISPEAPIPVLNVKQTSTHLGGAGNVVRNLAALSVPVTVIGAVGADDAAQEIAQHLEGMDAVTSQLITVKGRPTTCKIRYLAGGQQLLRADFEETGALSSQGQAAILEKVATCLPEMGAVILSDYGKGVLNPSVIASIIDQAQKHAIPVLVDPKGDDYSQYKGATLLTPNRAELKLAAKMPVLDDETIIAAAAHVMESCDVQGILATRSEQGMSLISKEETGTDILHLKARAREVFDVSGAGDTVIAVTAAVMAAGFDKGKAASLANVAAGIVVEKTGTAVAYPSEILAAGLEMDRAVGDKKQVSLQEALDRVAKWRREGLKVGFTNGCFDLLHPGHISLVDQSAAQCDRLILGLNSDASVKRLKGESRPVQDENARSTVLSSLGKVDLVVIFEEDTPLNVINALRPEILIKGADYTIETVVGAKEVMSWGGEVYLAQLVDGQSTTKTIGKMGAKPAEK